MNAHVKLPDGRHGELTIDHAASSYGQPVLIVDDAAYGPAEMPGVLAPIDPDDDDALELIESWYVLALRSRSLHAYGVAEIAAALGVETPLISVWRKRGKLPEPDITLRMGPVWFAATIEPWIAERRQS